VTEGISDGILSRSEGSSEGWLPSEDLFSEVLALLREAGGVADRKRLKGLAGDPDIEAPADAWSVEGRVGMALTVLHRRGPSGRQGSPEDSI